MAGRVVSRAPTAEDVVTCSCVRAPIAGRWHSTPRHHCYWGRAPWGGLLSGWSHSPPFLPSANPPKQEVPILTNIHACTWSWQPRLVKPTLTHANVSFLPFLLPPAHDSSLTASRSYLPTADIPICPLASLVLVLGSSFTLLSWR